MNASGVRIIQNMMPCTMKKYSLHYFKVATKQLSYCCISRHWCKQVQKFTQACSEERWYLARMIITSCMSSVTQLYIIFSKVMSVFFHISVTIHINTYEHRPLSPSPNYSMSVHPHISYRCCTYVIMHLKDHQLSAVGVDHNVP